MVVLLNIFGGFIRRLNTIGDGRQVPVSGGLVAGTLPGRDVNHKHRHANFPCRLQSKELLRTGLGSGNMRNISQEEKREQDATNRLEHVPTEKPGRTTE